MQHVLISVPAEDAKDLAHLQEMLSEPGQLIESKPFDGVLMLQILVPVTLASVPVLKLWIKSRFELRQTQSVSINGMNFTGYSPKEIEQIAKILEDDIEA
ncbi:hypothetical protein [Clavibacter michiganensis]|uniref:hypothetical protein n=1 Tax=Clavibacter michiganensis TaxID=28447 RepID=UPI0011B0DEE0|nr:hypothetical protein [Clavibacter michiganensis]